MGDILQLDKDFNLIVGLRIREVREAFQMTGKRRSGYRKTGQKIPPAGTVRHGDPLLCRCCRRLHQGKTAENRCEHPDPHRSPEPAVRVEKAAVIMFYTGGRNNAFRSCPLRADDRFKTSPVYR